MITLVVNALYFRLRSLLVLVVFERNLLKIMNMSKQVSVAANAAVQEANQPRVFNLTIAGARRSDATTSNGGIIEGAIVLFRNTLPVIIDGEEVNTNKKWFPINKVVDALIMSEDDGIAAKAADVIEGNFMTLRGTVARISVFDGEDGLHYKVEF